MVVLLADGGDANSNLTQSSGTQIATYTVPNNVAVKVQSVVATITNGAAGLVTPELTIVDGSGVVIARKRQLRSMPAGDSGTATWALRIDDDGSGTTGPSTLDDLILAIPGLVAFWKLNESSGTVAHDSSGNGHDMSPGVGYNPPTWGQTAGPPGQTTAKWPSYAGGGSWSVTKEAVTLTAFTNNFTAGVWVYSIDGHQGTLFGQGAPTRGSGSTDAKHGWAFNFSTGAAAVGFVGDGIGGAASALFPDSNLALGTWYFLVLVADAGTWKLYVNGVQQADTGATTAIAATNTWIGVDQAAADLTAYNVLLSYAFIANSVVSPSSIAALYASV